MDNRQIRELLQTAQNAKSSFERYEVLVEFHKALFQKSQCCGDQQEIRLCVNCLSSLLDSLFWGYLNKCPDEIMSLLPVFVMLCGDLSNTDSSNRLGRVDWQYFLEVMAEKNSTLI